MDARSPVRSRRSKGLAAGKAELTGQTPTPTFDMDMTITPLSTTCLQVPGASGYESQRKKSEILSITDKISKALNQMDNMYAEEEMHGLLFDVTDQVNSMESGPMKYQLKSFINNYKEVAAVADEAKEERDSILESLADWFTSKELSGMTSSLTDDDDDTVLDSYATAKIEFQKLKSLSKDIEQQSDQGRDTDALERERTRLQKNAVAKFKNYKQVAQKEERPNTAQHVEQAWKFAANEICDLLHAVRDKGADYLIDLEKMVKKMLSECEQQSDKIDRLKATVRENKCLERKYEGDNAHLTRENAELSEKLRKYQKEIKSLRQAKALGLPVKTSHLDEDDEQDMQSAHNFAAPVVSSGLGGGGDPTILKAQLRDCKKQIAKLTEENRIMIEEIQDLKEKLEDEEDSNMTLENDKKELLRQMKQSAVRPNTRRLSSQSIRRTSVSKQMFQGSVSGISFIMSPEKTVSQKCAKCGQVLPHPSTSSSPPNGSGHSLADKHKGEQPNPAVVEATISGEDLVKSIQQCKSQQAVIQDLQQQLGQAEQQILSLKSNSHVTVPYPTPLNTAQATTVQTPSLEGSTIGDQKPVQATFNHNSSNVIQGEMVNQEEQTLNNSQRDAKSRPMPNTLIMPQHIQPGQSDISAVVEGAIYCKPGTQPTDTTQIKMLICNRGMQTDPDMDPLGAWSISVDAKGSWRPPMPPAKWLNFDPTPGMSKAGSVESHYLGKRRSTIGQLMLEGVEPSEVREQAINCANFIEREFKRMEQGIHGFAEYTNSLVDREGHLMARANRELKSCLSMSELATLEQDLLRRASISNLGDGISKTFLHISDSRHADLAGKQLGARTPNQLELDITQLTEARENLTPIEERIKLQVLAIANRAIKTLRTTYELVFEALQAQHNQYESIYTTLQRKPRQLPIFLEMSEQRETELVTHAKISKSKLQIQGSMAGLLLVRSKTGVHTSAKEHLHSATRTPQPTVLHTQQSTYHGQPDNMSMKAEMKVATATIPKKGLIKLTTAEAPPKLNQHIMDFPLTKRKIKPAPISRAKMMKKQQELLTRGQKPAPERIITGRKKIRPPGTGMSRTIQPRTGMSPAGGFDLPEDFFSQYTVAELEKNVQKLADQSKMETRHSVFENTVALPVLQRRSTLDKAGVARIDTPPIIPALPILEETTLIQEHQDNRIVSLAGV